MWCPGAFGKHKGIRIKFKEIGYERILIGGMAAGMTRVTKESPPVDCKDK